MSENLINLAFIPARKGSKRFPLKNLIEFKGKKMFEYALTVARDCHMFDRIHFSTDDQKAMDIAKKYGISNCSLRPDEISGYDMRIPDLLEHTLKNYKDQGITFENVCVLYATAPMMSIDDVSSAFEKMEKECLDSICGAYECPKSPLHAFYIDKRKKIERLKDHHPNMNNENFVFDSGSFYWIKSKQFKKHRNFFGDKHGFYMLPHWKAVDIDYPQDLDLLEYYWEKYKKKEILQPSR